MTIDEMIAVLQAAKEGKAIEFRSKSARTSWGSAATPSWDFFSNEYRVKPEPIEIYMVYMDEPRCVRVYFDTWKSAESYWINHCPNGLLVKMREVIE